MTTLDALLAAILAAPDDDTPRLVWADAAEEAGLGERAEFVRVQVELAKYDAARKEGEWLCLHPRPKRRQGPPRHPHLRHVYEPGPEYEACGVCPPCALRERERDLLTTHGRAWGPDGWDWHVLHDLTLGATMEPYPTAEAKFSRGFVAEMTCPAADWIAHGDALYWRPGQTEKCERCEGVGEHLYVEGNPASYDWTCPVCDNECRVPRPVPQTAQPVETVKLSDDPRDIDGQDGQWRAVVKVETGLTIWKNDRWKGVEFELPPGPFEESFVGGRLT